MGHEGGAEVVQGRVGRRMTMLVTVLVAVSLLLSAGCQHADPGKDLRDRVTKYWQLKQSKSWPEVYDQYLDPAVKTQLTKEAFLKRRFLAFDIFSFEIASIKEDGDKAAVAVTNEVNFPLKAPSGEMQFIKKQVTTNDTWVRRDGAWYVDLKE
jgi:hypothetical protein